MQKKIKLRQRLANEAQKINKNNKFNFDKKLYLTF